MGDKGCHKHAVPPPNLLSQGGLVLGVPVEELHDVQQALDIPGEGTSYPPPGTPQKEGTPRGPHTGVAQGTLGHCPMQGEGLSTPSTKTTPPQKKATAPRNHPVLSGGGLKFIPPPLTRWPLGTLGDAAPPTGWGARGSLQPGVPGTRAVGAWHGRILLPAGAGRDGQGWQGLRTLHKQLVTWRHWEKVHAAGAGKGTRHLKGHPEPPPEDTDPLVIRPGSAFFGGRMWR